MTYFNCCELGMTLRNWITTRRKSSILTANILITCISIKLILQLHGNIFAASSSWQVKKWNYWKSGSSWDIALSSSTVKTAMNTCRYNFLYTNSKISNNNCQIKGKIQTFFSGREETTWRLVGRASSQEGLSPFPQASGQEWGESSGMQGVYLRGLRLNLSGLSSPVHQNKYGAHIKFNHKRRQGF